SDDVPNLSGNIDYNTDRICSDGRQCHEHTSHSPFQTASGSATFREPIRTHSFAFSPPSWTLGRVSDLPRSLPSNSRRYSPRSTPAMESTNSISSNDTTTRR